MQKCLFFLLIVLFMLPARNSVCLAATQPTGAAHVLLPGEAKSMSATLAVPQKKKAGLVARWKQKLLTKAIQKGWLGEGEMTERQKRQGRWSMILGLGSLVLLLLPYVSIVAIPAAIVALVLGIKSVNGNSNTSGIIGIIAGGLTLVLLLLAIALLAAFLASWN